MIGLTSLSKKVDKLDADLRSLTAKRDLPFVSPAVLKDALDKIEAKIRSARANFDDLAEDRKALMPEVEEKLETLRKKIMEVLSNISSNTSGGGNANRNIQVASVNVLRPFTDINFIAGSNVTITTSPNQTTKYTDITIASTGAAGSDITIGTTTITGGTDTRILYNNAGVVGEYTLTGTGTVVAMQTGAQLVTPDIGVATGTSLTLGAAGVFATSTRWQLLAGGATGRFIFANAGATTAVSMDVSVDGTAFFKTSGNADTAILKANGIQATGALTALTLNGLTITGNGTNTLNIAAGKTLTVSNILTFTGTDSSSVAFGGGGTVLYTASVIPLTVGTTTIASGTDTRILYDNAGVLGEYTLTGTGTVVAMATSPTFITSIITPTVRASANDSGSLGASGTAFSDLFLADGGVINWVAGNATITHSTGLLTTNVPVTITGLATASGFEPTATTATGNRMYLPAANTLGFSINGTGEVQLTSTALSPIADGGNSLGTTALGWQNLFGNTGFVLNIENSDWVATHTAGILTVGTGDLRVTNAGANTASVVTVGGTQTLAGKTLTAPVINAATLSGTITLAESTSIALDPAQGDATWTGITRAGTAGATLAFGDLCYLAAADSRWELTDADSATTADRMLGMCVLAAAADGDPTVMLLMGNIQAASKFPAMTVGSAMYISDATAGAIITTIPTGADNVIRRVGYALTADELYFCPSMDSQITVA